MKKEDAGISFNKYLLIGLSVFLYFNDDVIRSF